MLLLGILLFAALFMLVTAFAVKKSAIAFSASGFWIVFGVYCYTLSGFPATGVWDIYYGLVWLSVGLVLLCALEPAIMKPKKEDETEDVTVDEIDEYGKQWDAYNDKLQKSVLVARRPRRHMKKEVWETK